MDQIDFSKPSDERNIAFEVEGQQLWVSRETLALYSPVFKTMFYSDFREKKEQSIPLPDKKLVDMRELLFVLTPPILKPVDSENVDVLLDLAREYSIDALKQRCNDFLVKTLRKSSVDSDRYLDILVLACKYDMFDLMEQCIPKVAQLPTGAIDARQCELPTGVLAALYQAKLSKWKKHCRHDLTGPPAPASARPQYNVNVFGGGGGGGGGPGVFGQGVAPGILSYFCSTCNTTFTSMHQRLTCQFCKITVCDECARCRPCVKSLEHGDTCECECDYNKELLRRGNN